MKRWTWWMVLMLVWVPVCLRSAEVSWSASRPEVKRAIWSALLAEHAGTSEDLREKMMASWSAGGYVEVSMFWPKTCDGCRGAGQVPDPDQVKTGLKQSVEYIPCHRCHGKGHAMEKQQVRVWK